ncbi:hypothetical protein BUQ74_17285 [Leptospira weilii serovar Heyan]|nr:hypothetical protein BUQ74_17285 [Leptospira weilii serovar Heyan]
MQVKSLILVGTLQKYQLLILLTPEPYAACGVGYDRTSYIFLGFETGSNVQIKYLSHGMQFNFI